VERRGGAFHVCLILCIDAAFFFISNLCGRAFWAITSTRRVLAMEESLIKIGRGTSRSKSGYCTLKGNYRIIENTGPSNLPTQTIPLIRHSDTPPDARCSPPARSGPPFPSTYSKIRTCTTNLHVDPSASSSTRLPQFGKQYGVKR